MKLKHLFTILLCLISISYAEMMTIQGNNEGSTTYADKDNFESAFDYAKKNAVKNAVENYALAIRSETWVINGELERDVIVENTLAMVHNVVIINSTVDKSKNYIHVEISCKIDTAEVNARLKKLIEENKISGITGNLNMLYGKSVYLTIEYDTSNILRRELIGERIANLFYKRDIKTNDDKNNSIKAIVKIYPDESSYDSDFGYCFKTTGFIRVVDGTETIYSKNFSGVNIEEETKSFNLKKEKAKIKSINKLIEIMDKNL